MSDLQTFAQELVQYRADYIASEGNARHWMVSYLIDNQYHTDIQTPLDSTAKAMSNEMRAALRCHRKKLRIAPGTRGEKKMLVWYNGEQCRPQARLGRWQESKNGRNRRRTLALVC